MKSRSAIAVLALSLALAAPAAFAGESSGASLAGFFAGILEFLDNGSALDPSGDEADSRGAWDPNGFAAGDDGRGIDPNGFTSAGREDGIGIDPHGGPRGLSTGPDGTDRGAGLDPNG